MEDLSTELQTFLLNHPCFILTKEKKVKCTLNDHEFPCSLAELQKFTQAKKYKSLSATAEFNYRQYEPHIVPSTKRPSQLFCKLTLRHLNRQPHHVQRHVNGKRFKKALDKYEECKKQGIDFVPARLKQKRPKDLEEDYGPGSSSKRGGGQWEPASSEGEASDSDDSMSDLYPSSMFTLKNPEAEQDGEEDTFLTDEEEEEEESMQTEKTVTPKRKKAQNGGVQKKSRNNNWKANRSKKQKKAPQAK